MTDNKRQQLFMAIQKLQTPLEVEAFCKDLMTPGEIEAFADRLEVAMQLSQGKSQRTVSADTGVSIATVTRVNRFLTRGNEGYRTIIDRLNSLHPHSANGLGAVARV